jgi:D-alanyl-D-alanine carboxypeptidase
MTASPRASLGVALALCVTFAGLVTASPDASAATSADDKLDAALQKIVAREDGPPGIVVVVQRATGEPEVHTAGVADTTTSAPPTLDDRMRLASVAKAYSGAAAWSLIADGKLSKDATVGKTLPGMPPAWADITLVQLLQHTSGIPDFSGVPAFKQAFAASLLTPPPPEQLAAYVAEEPLNFSPGSKYQYSNTDNVLVGLMVQQVAGTPYEEVLAQRVYEPLGLTATRLPSGPTVDDPKIHGYNLDPPLPPEDLTEAFAAGWTWASGGVVSTPAETNAFIRGYVSGKVSSREAQRAQFTFRPGSSEPTGPGKNSAGPGLFRYETSCGTVYGHTGNTAGYTQFIAASRDGTRSTVVSINSQITPRTDATRFVELRKIYGLAVCAAMAKGR